MLCRYRSLVLLLSLALALMGCQFTQSSFTRTANDGGSIFAAAATTLQYLHQGKITRPYAISSFANYQSALQGLDQQLSSSPGATRPQELRSLLGAYKSAFPIVEQPCLDDSCRWQQQVSILRHASTLFLEVTDA